MLKVRVQQPWWRRHTFFPPAFWGKVCFFKRTVQSSRISAGGTLPLSQLCLCHELLGCRMLVSEAWTTRLLEQGYPDYSLSASIPGPHLSPSKRASLMLIRGHLAVLDLPLPQAQMAQEHNSEGTSRSVVPLFRLRKRRGHQSQDFLASWAADLVCRTASKLSDVSSTN